MQINRQSYEEYFLLYADGELNESERRAVEEFIDQNPDLAGELNIIQETVFKPDGSIIFENKDLLLKNESDDRKVFYMSWFRIAAAAGILVALTLTGWIFFGERNTHSNLPVTVARNQEVKKTEPKEIVVSNETKEVPVKQQAVSKKAKASVKIIQSDIKAEDKNIATERDVADAQPPAKPMEGAAFTQDVVQTQPGKETIDVAVEPRAMDNNKDDEPHSDVSYAQTFPQEQDDDMIYFANTSLTKKTKLRGVLRKATRYLDRVTSLQ
jgi:hypothetical protein